MFLLTNDHLIAQKPQPLQPAFQGKVLFYSLSWLHFLEHAAEGIDEIHCEVNAQVHPVLEKTKIFVISHGRSLYFV